MSYAYAAYGYNPYGAYGALSPYDVNALGLIQAYRALGTKADNAPEDRSGSKENAAPTVVSSGSGSMSINAIKKLIKENVDALQKTCQGCPPEYKGRFERVEKRLVEISNELKAGKLSPELVANIEKIVNDIQSLQNQAAADYNNLKTHVDATLDAALNHLHDEAQEVSRQLENRLKLQNLDQNVEFHQERHASEQKFQQSIADILKRIDDIDKFILQAKDPSSEISQELIEKLEKISNDIQSLHASHNETVETQTRFEGDLGALRVNQDRIANGVREMTGMTRTALANVEQEISNMSLQIDTLSNVDIAEINAKVKKLESLSEQEIPVAPAMQVNNGVQSVISSVEQRIAQMHLTTPSACDIRTAILQYQYGTMHSLTFEQLAQIIQDESGSNIELLEKEKTVRTFLLRFIEKYINNITPVPTYVDKLIDRDEIARKQDIISAFIRVIDKSADHDITRYPCLLLYFLFQFEAGTGGEQSFKVFRT